ELLYPVLILRVLTGPISLANILHKNGSDKAESLHGIPHIYVLRHLLGGSYLVRSVMPMAHHWQRRRSVPVAQSSCPCYIPRSEEHTSELQSRENLVCRLLL